MTDQNKVETAKPLDETELENVIGGATSETDRTSLTGGTGGREFGVRTPGRRPPGGRY